MLEPALLAAINHLLRDADWARQRLSGHAGSTARIDAGLGAMTFAVTGDGLLAPPPAGDRQPDLVLELPPAALPMLIEDREALMRAAQMRGNVEFAEALGFVFRNLRWDVEEDLSRLTGDIAAHRIVQAGEGVRQSLVDGVRRLGDALSEYVLHEASVAVRQDAVVDYCRAVDELRDHLERIDARLRRLERPATASR